MYRALKTFSGRITMVEGEIREIKDPLIVADLLGAHYIEEVTVIEKTEEKPKRRSKAK